MPSKKIIIPVICISLLAGGWWLFTARKEASVAKEHTIEKTDAGLSRVLAADSDGDGLKDWEEALWKTNPHDPDTDKDGAADNDEILAKRDPRKPGPNDEMNPRIVDEINAAPSGDEENITARLARNFTTTYFSQKITSASAGDGLIEKDGLKSQVFSDIARTITQEDVIDNKPKFSAEDFQISASPSENDARTYINTLGNIFKSASFPEKSDIEAISEAIVKQDQDIQGIKDLQLYQDGYEKLAQDMKTAPIPQSFLETHVAMANNFWRLGLYLKEFINIETDPIKGMIALNGYAKEGAQSIEFLKKIVEEIKIKGFSFSEEEGGSEFNKYLNI